MTNPAKSALAGHRARMARRGLVRVEVDVNRDDAGLVRLVAAALSDPARRDAAHAIRPRQGRSNAGCATSRPRSPAACWGSTTRSPTNGAA